MQRLANFDLRRPAVNPAVGHSRGRPAVALLLPLAAALLWSSTAAAQSSELMTSLATGVVKGVGSEIGGEATGWAMSALGLDSHPDPNGEVVAALEQISAQLGGIATEIGQTNTLLQQALCQTSAGTTTHEARTFIDTLVGTGPTGYQGLLILSSKGDDVNSELDSLFDKVLNGDFNNDPVELQLQSLHDALMDVGIAEGGITACVSLLPGPTEQFDDRAYYEDVHDFMDFFFAYQAQGALLLVDAYHRLALQAWITAGNDKDSLLPEDVFQICDQSLLWLDPNGHVKTNCDKAQLAYEFVAQNIREQYAHAGAPYSTGTPDDPTALCPDLTDPPCFNYDATDPIVQINNHTGMLWVKDLDDFFRRAGYSSICFKSTSANPCGPGVGSYDYAAFNLFFLDGRQVPMRYGANGGYTTWEPAPADEWSDLLANWSTNSQTLEDYLRSEYGFAGSFGARVFFTGDVHDSVHKVAVFSQREEKLYQFESKEVACFVCTAMKRNNSTQPFCSTGIGNLMHSASDHLNSNRPCFNAKNSNYNSLMDAGITAPFFDFLYNIRAGECKSDGHPLGLTFYPRPPGWLLRYRSLIKQNTLIRQDTGDVDLDGGRQYHWPVLDTSERPCKILILNEKSVVLTNLNLGGAGPVPTLCGDDFDAWFDKWVIPPPQVGASPQVNTPAPLVVQVPPSSEEAVPHHEVTTMVHHDHLVEVIDAEDGVIPFNCHPPSGTHHQLGITEVRCTAVDSHGNETVETFLVHVQYPFEFGGELSDGGAGLDAGRTLDVTFRLGGDRGLDVLVDGVPMSAEADCGTGEITGPLEPMTSNEDGLRYRQGVYTYLWTTPRAYRGQCRQVVLDLVDGTRHTALVEFGDEILAPFFLRGDSNADGRVDVADGIFTLGFLFAGNQAPPCLDAADTDDSGQIDIADSTGTFNYLFLGGATPAPPGPGQCGDDTTRDGLGCAAFAECP